MFSRHSKNKEKIDIKQEAETGQDFYRDEPISFQIEAQRQYVQRLKMQRQKIEALYTKYDSLISQLKKKDDRIKQLERNLSDSQLKFKQLQLVFPQLQGVKAENYRLYNQNQALRTSLDKAQESYSEIFRELSAKSAINQQQAQKIDEINAQLTTKIRIWQQKLEDKSLLFEKQKKEWLQKLDLSRKMLDQQKKRHIQEISILNEQLLKKDEQMEILHLQLQRSQQNILYLEQSNLDMTKQTETKMCRLQLEHKNRVKAIKQEIQEANYNSEMLTNKITLLNSEIEKIKGQNIDLRNNACEDKKLNDDTVYKLKLQFSHEKSIMREHTVQLENKINKLQKQLGQCLRRQKGLNEEIRMYREGQHVKKSIREVQRRQLQKINRLLLLQK